MGDDMEKSWKIALYSARGKRRLKRQAEDL